MISGRDATSHRPHGRIAAPSGRARQGRIRVGAASAVLLPLIGCLVDGEAKGAPRSRHTEKATHSGATTGAHGLPAAATRPATHPAHVNGAAETLSVSGARRAFHFSQAQHAADSATRITAETLVRHGVVGLTGLQNLAPNVTIQSLMGTASTNFFIRGVGFNDYTQNNTSSIMTYIDDVPFPLSTMASGMMFDIADVDIQPGPSGTTHGLTDSGGEVNIRTADPTETWHGGVTQDIASYARSRTDLYISGPITDKLSFRIAGQTMHGGGWQYSPANHTHLGDANEGALRAKLLWKPDEHTEIKLTGHWTQDNSGVVVGKPVLNFLPAAQSIPTLGYQQANWDLRPQFAQLIGRSANTMPSEHNTFWGFDLNMSHDFGFATLRSISAYETEREGEYTDQDGTTYASGDQYRNIVANSFTQEVNLKSNDHGQRLQWVVGMTYNRVRMSQQFYFDFTDYVPLRGYLSETSFRQNQQTFNQYAYVSYRLPYSITLFGGINHEADDRQLLGLRTVHFGINNLNFNNEGAAANQFAGTVGIQWQAAKNLMFYYKMSKGFKPGGFTGNNTVVQAQLTPFRPESLLAYEAGFKSDIIPNVFRLNASAFYYDYHNQQYISSYLVPSYGPLGMFVNIPKSEIWGVEFTTNIHPLPHVYLMQNLGYERGKYQKFLALNSTATNAYYTANHVWQGIYTDYGGVDSGIPKLTLNGTADYRFNPLRHYELETGLDWMYRGSQALVAGGLGSYRLPAYFLMGAHMTFHPVSDRWSATIYASNLLNRQYFVAGGQATTTYFWIPGAPRFIGGRLSANF
ncbi:TonB-dependent receptor [Acetobacter nitrogenifigens]|uniref:TonB-dependent receptor n=1 Tax=Acetobacter nitrogenifigens TaxID=285268 RepID=UPI000A03DB2B